MKKQRLFEVLWGDTVIGTTLFESGDAPMGVAYGKFIPNTAYEPQHVIDHGRLAARYAGRLIPSVGGVRIEDQFEELGERQVTIFGVGYPLYEELFPEHRQAYEALYPMPFARSRRFLGLLRRLVGLSGGKRWY